MPRSFDHLWESRIAKAAVAEAKSLLALEAGGCGGRCAAQCGDVAEVLEVPRRQMHTLLAFARAHPEDARRIGRALRFRARVAVEFRKLKEAA